MAKDGAKIFLKLSSQELGMPSRLVYFVVSFQITEGKVDTFKEIARVMIAATQKESGTLGYDWHFSSDNKLCRLLETYTDEAAVQAHIEGEAVKLIPKLLEAASISGFEVYGDTGPKAAETLKAFGAELFQPWDGLRS
ncbi:MAG: putative quinol monooxygenase [Terriglobales bacterium]